jgi:hypothetical protein
MQILLCAYMIALVKEMMGKRALKLNAESDYVGEKRETEGADGRPGAKTEKVDRWWLKYRDSNQKRIAKGLKPLEELESR